MTDDAVVVTGLAAVSALGHGADRCWQALVDGASGIRPITRFDTTQFPVKLAGEVPEVPPDRWLDRRLVVATDRWTQFGLIATHHALADARLDLASVDPYRVAVLTAAASGGNEFGQREIQSLWRDGPRAVTVYQSIAWFYAATTGQVSIRHGSKGQCGVLAGGGAAGLDVFGEAARALDTGADVALVGGTDAAISPYALTCQATSGMLSPSADPATAFRPYSPDATGYVVGEGGAMFVLERAASAEHRGVEPLAVVSGHAARQDGRRARDVDPDSRGAGLAEAIRAALEAACLQPADVDVLFADAAGVTVLDEAERRAIRRALGRSASSVPVVVTKGATGRMEAAGACFDVFAAVRTLSTGVVPPSVGVPGDSGLDVSTVARQRNVEHALVLARGHGGFNSALVLGSGRPHRPARVQRSPHPIQLHGGQP